MQSNINLEIVNKIEMLQQELQELRGILEEQKHLVERLAINNNSGVFPAEKASIKLTSSNSVDDLDKPDLVPVNSKLGEHGYQEQNTPSKTQSSDDLSGEIDPAVSAN